MVKLLQNERIFAKRKNLHISYELIDFLAFNREGNTFADVQMQVINQSSLDQ
jgi:hypothetical protein